MAKKPLSSLFDDNDDDDVVNTTTSKGVNYTTLLNTLYSAKESIHLTHNAQKTKDKSIHEALGPLYEVIGDKIDRFVECIFGIYGTASLSFSAKVFDNPVQYCKSLYNQIESERKVFKESWIQNMIDTFQEDIAMALYQLQYVKSNP